MFYIFFIWPTLVQNKPYWPSCFFLPVLLGVFFLCTLFSPILASSIILSRMLFCLSPPQVFLGGPGPLMFPDPPGGSLVQALGGLGFPERFPDPPGVQPGLSFLLLSFLHPHQLDHLGLLFLLAIFSPLLTHSALLPASFSPQPHVLEHLSPLY